MFLKCVAETSEELRYKYIASIPGLTSAKVQIIRPCALAHCALSSHPSTKTYIEPPHTRRRNNAIKKGGKMTSNTTSCQAPGHETPHVLLRRSGPQPVPNPSIKGIPVNEPIFPRHQVEFAS